jgi:hypothetical protein
VSRRTFLAFMTFDEELLRDAFNSDTIAEVEHLVDPGEFGKINDTIIRVTRRK